MKLRNWVTNAQQAYIKMTPKHIPITISHNQLSTQNCSYNVVNASYVYVNSKSFFSSEVFLFLNHGRTKDDSLTTLGYSCGPRDRYSSTMAERPRELGDLKRVGHFEAKFQVKDKDICSDIGHPKYIAANNLHAELVKRGPELTTGRLKS